MLTRRLEALRAIIVRIAAEARPASERVDSIRQQTTDYVKEVEAQVAATRTARKRRRGAAAMSRFMTSTRSG